MGGDLTQFWSTGLAAVGIGIAALVVLVRYDLAPAGPLGNALDGGGRLFLGAALGIGIIAFSIKLIVVFLLTSFPDKTVTPLLPTPEERAKAYAAIKFNPMDAFRFTSPGQSNPWSALPDTPPIPIDNPMNDAKVALGRRLFNDKRLSRDETVSCASCHDLLNHGGADGRMFAVGVDGAVGNRNTPTVINAAFQDRLFWDGRAASLEQQAVGPLLNPIEMAMPSAQAVVDRITRDESYRLAFKAAFGPRSKVSIENIAKAIAAFERTLTTNDTPYDRFINGDTNALSNTQKRGMYLFRKLGCKVCHAGPNFSGASLIGPRRPFAHLRTDRLEGKMLHGLSEDKGRGSTDTPFGLWRIPSLRNVALTAPYFHNGSVDTLTEAVRVMARAQLNRVLVTPNDGTKGDKLAWSLNERKFITAKQTHIRDKDISNLVAFLQSLTSDRLKPQKTSRHIEK